MKQFLQLIHLSFNWLGSYKNPPSEGNVKRINSISASVHNQDFYFRLGKNNNWLAREEGNFPSLKLQQNLESQEHFVLTLASCNV